MPRKYSDKQINCNFSPDLYEEIKKSATAAGLSVSSFLRNAAHQAVLSDFREAIPEQGDKIEIFQTYISKIMEAYKDALDASQTAYETASSKVRGELAALKTLTDQNATLNTKVEEAKKIISELKNQNAQLQTQLDTTKQKFQEIETLKSEKESLQKQVITLRQQLVEQRDSYTAQLKKLQDDDFEKILRVVSAKNS